MLVNTRFQVLFHSAPAVLFTFPSRYFSSIGHQVVFRLGGWSPLLPIGFHVSDRTLDTARCLCVSSTCLSHSPDGFPTPFDYASSMLYAVRTPNVLLPSVWPLSLSLAATHKISFDFSSYGYLDVSVPHVPLLNLLIQLRIPDSSSGWFPNSDICGSRYICYSPQLFAACHVLRRLPMPRHPPYALLRLNSLQTSSACSRSLELLELAFRKLFLL